MLIICAVKMSIKYIYSLKLRLVAILGSEVTLCTDVENSLASAAVSSKKYKD